MVSIAQIEDRPARRATVPDLAYIRDRIPIREVAIELGLEIRSNQVRCWRPEAHQHGDRTPSVGLEVKRNKAKCFVCDSLPLSPIDLVMDVLHKDISGAVEWFLQRYEIPNIPKRKRTDSQQRWPERVRVGTGTSRLESLVRYGIWAATLSASQQSVLVVLDVFSDGNTVTISYRGLIRYTGIRSQSTISTALKRLRNLRVLQPKQQENDEAGLRACGSYQWTMDEPEFHWFVAKTYEKHRNEIELEGNLRARARSQKVQRIHYR